MATHSSKTGKHFYSQASWDENTWIDVIAVEYARLIDAYPFSKLLDSFSQRGEIRLLDIGCGTGIFPRFLDPVLSSRTALRCDLLDISASSLQTAKNVFGQLKHFEVNQLFNIAIEDIPKQIDVATSTYSVIWAIHSLTTVDQTQMKEVFQHIRELLSLGGRFFIYQLTSQSTYQALHRIYAQSMGMPNPEKPYMEYEDSLSLLNEIDWSPEVYQLEFPHRISRKDPATLEAYLQKVVLDNSINANQVFDPHLGAYLEGDEFVFPQKVNLIVLHK